MIPKVSRCFLLSLGACLLLGSLPAAAEPPTFSVTVPSGITSLPFRVKDAEFSTALNAIVAVAESPNQLHIYYPDTDLLVSVNLQVPPTCVSVSPNGLQAVVGHNAWISVVDLSTPSLLKTVPVSANVIDIVHGGNGYAYAFAGDGYTRSLNLSTDVVVNSNYNFRNPAAARLHPAGDRIYGADRGTSPDDVMRINVNNGPAVFAYDSIYHGDYAMCGDVWISMDGLRLFTACGNTFRASSDPNFDIRFAGKLSQENRITWTTHSQSGNSIAVLPGYSQFSFPPAPRIDNEIHYYTHDFLLYRGKAILPSFVVQNTSWAPRGRWLFFNAAGTKQYVIVQADEASGILYDYGVVTVDCTAATVSVDPTTLNVGAASSNVQVNVTGTAGCGWKATSNAAWIETFSSGVSDGTVAFTVAANATADSRSGSITVGNATINVTQSAPLPVAVAATASAPASISITWTAEGAVDHYEVWRSSGGAFTMVGAPAAAPYTDTTVSAGNAYVYKVRSVVSGGATTAFGLPDYAHTFTFTDAPLAAGMDIKAAHITELRSVAAALRAAAGLGAPTFTDPSLPGVVAKAVHITELRDSINAVRTALGLPSLTFPALSAGSTIEAQTTEELRTGTR
jgi:hypothetical protein